MRGTLLLSCLVVAGWLATPARADRVRYSAYSFGFRARVTRRSFNVRASRYVPRVYGSRAFDRNRRYRRATYRPQPYLPYRQTPYWRGF